MVPCDSPVDRHAQANTTSVYTPAEIFPMLPERLSTDLTSLNEGEDRPAVVVDMTMNGEGGIHSADVYLATVRNRAKLVYPSVGAWLEGHGPAPPKLTAVNGLEENVRIQDAAARALKESRHRRGALTLDTIEGRPIFDGDNVRDVTASGRTRASELIEDFMIAANTSTALFLESRGFWSLRRIVRMPERWLRIVALAAETGLSCRLHRTVGRSSNGCSHSAAAMPIALPISLSVVKLLGRRRGPTSSRSRISRRRITSGSRLTTTAHSTTLPIDVSPTSSRNG